MSHLDFSRLPYRHFEDDLFEQEELLPEHPGVLTTMVTYTGGCEQCSGPCQGHTVEIGELRTQEGQVIE
jgi:hypothetical protein